MNSAWPPDWSKVGSYKDPIGRWLYAAAAERGWSQADLAKRSGVERNAVIEIVQMQRAPTVDEMAALAAALAKNV